MRRFWYAVVFCMLTTEFEGTWEKHWGTPWQYVSSALLAPVPGIRVPWYDVIVLVLALTAPRSAGRTKPIESYTWLTIGTLLTWGVYGALRGGSVIDMRLQLHIMVMMLLTSFMQARLLRTREDLRTLGMTIVYAALFRFSLMLIFYLTVMRSLTVRMETVTDHADTLLFVTTIVIVIAEAIHSRSRAATRRAIVITPLMLWCIQINNRRLAYVSLVGALLVMLSLLWTREFRKKLLRFAKYAVPILGLYVGIGWSQPKGIFKPIAALQSANDAKDPSTASRILENMGLVVTLQSNPILGTGFGQKYTEISTTYSVGEKVFPQYRYMPHNSLFGLVTFSGALGFSGIWLIFPVTAFFAARSYAMAKVPVDKTIAMVSLCEIIIHTNQMWGDLGNSAYPGLVLMSGAIAATSRLAVFTGAWPAARGARARPARTTGVATHPPGG